MTDYQSIQIDFEVHKRIESERRSFSETPNAVLRRLLKIGGEPPASQPTHIAQGRAWSSHGVTLRHGTELRMEYNGRQYVGAIDDGSWLIDGQRYNSPSHAAGSVALTKAGKHTKLDGWIYWHVKRPGENRWIAISALRDAAQL